MLGHLTRRQKTSLKRISNQILRFLIYLALIWLVAALRRLWNSLPPIVAWLLVAFLFCFLLSLIPVLLLRWVNPPWSVFMWQVRSSLRRAGEDGIIEHCWVDYGRISTAMHLAAIAVEDPDFPVHTGFALRRMFRVWRENRRGKTLQGASTITQQLAKNMFLIPSRTYARKLAEAYLAVLLELTLSKRRILEIYLNIVQLDRQVFGVGAAAERFFGKPAAQLTVDEAALLAAALPNPMIFRVACPSDATRLRQRFVLKRMRELGFDYLGLIG